MTLLTDNSGKLIYKILSPQKLQLLTPGKVDAPDGSVIGIVVFGWRLRNTDKDMQHGVTDATSGHVISPTIRTETRQLQTIAAVRKQLNIAKYRCSIGIHLKLKDIFYPIKI